MRLGLYLGWHSGSPHVQQTHLHSREGCGGKSPLAASVQIHPLFLNLASLQRGSRLGLPHSRFHGPVLPSRPSNTGEAGACQEGRYPSAMAVGTSLSGILPTPSSSLEPGSVQQGMAGLLLPHMTPIHMTGLPLPSAGSSLQPFWVECPARAHSSQW